MFVATVEVACFVIVIVAVFVNDVDVFVAMVPCVVFAVAVGIG